MSEYYFPRLVHANNALEPVKGRFPKESLEPVARLVAAAGQVNAHLKLNRGPETPLRLLRGSLLADLQQSLPPLISELTVSSINTGNAAPLPRLVSALRRDGPKLMDAASQVTLWQKAVRPQEVLKGVINDLSERAYNYMTTDKPGTRDITMGFRKSAPETLLPYSHGLLEQANLKNNKGSGNKVIQFNDVWWLMASADLHSDPTVKQALQRSHTHLDPMDLPRVQRILQASLLTQAEIHLSNASQPSTVNNLEPVLTAVANNVYDAHKYVQQVLGDVTHVEVHGIDGVPTFHHALHPPRTSEWLTQHLDTFSVEMGGHRFKDATVGTAFWHPERGFDSGLPNQVADIEEFLPKLFRRVFT